MTRKSPAFSFYPNDWFEGTMLMPAIQRAAYIDLLGLQWVRGGFSREDAHLAVRGVSAEDIDIVIAEKFDEAKPNWFLNHRLESEREKQGKRTRTARENGRKGGRPKTQEEPTSKPRSKPTSKAKHKPKANPEEKLSDSDSVSDLVLDTDSKENIPTECLSGTSELVPELEFPVRGGTWWVKRAKLEQWVSTYGDAEWVESQIKSARQWILDNPTKLKTTSGMDRFLGGWLARNNNRGQGPVVVPAASRVATAHDMANYNPIDGGLG